MFAGGFCGSAQAQGMPVPAAAHHNVRDHGRWRGAVRPALGDGLRGAGYAQGEGPARSRRRATETHL